ncbi:MAG: hypothetical protein P8H59_02215 [Flavobacteriales bacterium]|nr:hypothetical protein [Flavobacteriales bacterium]MDG1779739.1 hypothetical protein [Flavobacteriales bacterium]MDG2247200.1 hypothetical protein [Flavobacteriales bacterium]
MRKLLIYLSCFLFLAACKKEEEINEVPEITFDSISSTTVVEFDNNISITVAYSDENGDIGYQDPDTYSLRVKDSRLAEYDWYHIPPLTPEMEELNIEGTFTVELNSLFLLGNSTQETTTFTIQLKDRSGNWSNQIVTPVVMIVDSL